MIPRREYGNRRDFCGDNIFIVFLYFLMHVNMSSNSDEIIHLS